MKPGFVRLINLPALTAFGPYWIDKAQIVGVTPTYSPTGKRGLFLLFHGGGTMLVEDETGVAAIDAWLQAQANPLGLPAPGSEPAADPSADAGEPS